MTVALTTCLFFGGNIPDDKRKAVKSTMVLPAKLTILGQVYKRLPVQTFNGWVKYDFIGKACEDCHGSGLATCDKCHHEDECDGCWGTGIERKIQTKEPQ